MDHLSIANGSVMFLLCAVAVAVVLLQAVMFMRKAWNRGLELGMEKPILKKVITNSGMFSIIPSLPILIVLILLMPNLGRFFPGFRMTIVGSSVYENMASNLTAQAFGLESIADSEFTKEIFVSAMWVMTIGVVWGPLFTAFGAKSIQKGMKKMQSNSKNSAAIFSVLFITLMAVFSGTYLAAPFRLRTTGIIGIIPLWVAITAGLFVFFMDFIVVKTNKKVIGEFSFPISLVVGMAAAIVYTSILT